MKNRTGWIGLLLCGILLFAGAACNKCDSGCDVTNEINGAIFNVPADSLHLPTVTNEVLVPVHLYVLSTSISRQGDRSCSHKDLSICFDDAIDFDQLWVRCNGDLYLQDTLIKAGTDLMALPFITERKYGGPNQTNLATLTLNVSQAFRSGTYTFFLDGKTKNGKPFADTAVLSWYY